MSQQMSQSNLSNYKLSVSDEMRRCIEICMACHSACEDLVKHCLEMGHEHAAPEHIRLLTDCAQICQTSADFMLRDSDQHMLICGVCAEICEACADDCDRFQDDQKMQQCAEVCRRCAESCRKMAA